jgi:pimeloyl-ACP methyl ester carboxylesterase
MTRTDIVLYAAAAKGVLCMFGPAPALLCLRIRKKNSILGVVAAVAMLGAATAGFAAESPKLRPLPADLSFGALFAPNRTYPYFEQADRFPLEKSAGGFSQANASRLADVALLAYVRDRAFVTDALRRGGFDCVEFFDRDGARALGAIAGGQIVIGFCGTEPDDRRDWADDANFGLVPVDGGGSVHAGFRRAWESLRVDIGDWLRKLDAGRGGRLPLWTCGHSMGGALAILCAAAQPDRSAGVYVYGCPRVGDGAFRKTFEGLRVFRVENNNDIVADLPPPGRYEHLGEEWYLDAAGALHREPGPRERVFMSLQGHRARIEQVWDSWRRGDTGAFPSDYVVDHAPVFYATHLWNSLVRGRASAPDTSEAVRKSAAAR